MYKITFTPLCCIIALFLLGQDKIIFKDNFKNNKHHWIIQHDTEFNVSIQNRALVFKKKDKNRQNNWCLWYEKAIPHFKSDKDFTITFYAKIISSDDVLNGFDFQWGMINAADTSRNAITSLYQLDFDLTKVRLSKFDNINYWIYYDWSDNYNESFNTNFKIQRGVLYKYQIIQKQNNLTVKIEDTSVYEIPITPQKGSSIGVQQCLKSNWKMSKLSIQQ